MKHEISMAEFLKEPEQMKKAKVAAEEKANRDKMQYSAILIVIFLLFGLVFFIARFTIPGWLLELSVFLPFLLLFESLLTFTDPKVAAITGGAILWKLLFNIVIAAILYPVHNFFEKKLKARAFKIKRGKVWKR